MTHQSHASFSFFQHAFQLIFSSNQTRVLLPVLLVVLLTACGGGGGGGGGDGSNFTISTSQVTFNSTVNGSTPATQSVTGRITGVNQSIYLVVIHTQIGISNVSVEITGAESGRLTIRPRSPAQLTVGTHIDTIELYACYDRDCNRQVSGSPRVITVTHTVNPETTLVPSSESLSFSAVESQTSSSQVVSLSSTSNLMPTWLHQVLYTTGANWLVVNEDTVNNTLDVNVLPVVAGDYSATLRINYWADGQNKQTDIEVNYTSTSIATLSHESIEINSIEGDLPAQQVINVGFGSTSPPAWSASVIYTNENNWLSLTQEGSSLIVQPELLPIGTYQANIRIQYSMGALGNSFVDLPVSYTVNRGVTLSNTGLVIDVVEGEASSAIPIAINYSGNGTITWSLSVEYQDDSNWLVVSPASGSSLPANFSVSTLPLAQGTYAATINVDYSFGDNTSRIQLPVTYRSSIAWLVPDTIDFVIDGSATMSDLQQILTIADNYNGSSNLNWVASVSAPWVSLSQETGDTLSNNQITLSLVNSEIETLDNGSYSTSLVLVSDDVNVASISIPVNLSLGLPIINYIAPYVEYVDTVGLDYKIIRGNQLSGVTNNVMFGAQPAVNVVQISDTEIHVTPPVLPEGRYPVFVENTLGIQRSTAELVVKTAPTFTDSSIATNIGIVSRAIYDEEREIVLSHQCYTCTIGGGGTPATIYRFNYNNGWQMTSHSYPGLIDISLTPDGRELIVLTSSRILHVDPDTMTTNRVVSHPLGTDAAMMAITNNGKVIFIRARMTYSLLDGSFESFSIVGPTSGISASPDGSRAVTGESVNFTAYPLRYYDASTEEWITTSLGGYYFSSGVFDRHANRLFFGNYLVDENFNLIGRLPTGVGHISGVMSQDGTTVYDYNYGDSQIDVVDVSGLPPFVLSAPIPTPFPGATKMTINLNGEILFLVGEDLFIIENLNF